MALGIVYGWQFRLPQNTSGYKGELGYCCLTKDHRQPLLPNISSLGAEASRLLYIRSPYMRPQ